VKKLTNEEWSLLEDLVLDGIALREHHNTTMDGERYRREVDEGYRALAILQELDPEDEDE
jgi:hypothetical protein